MKKLVAVFVLMVAVLGAGALARSQSAGLTPTKEQTLELKVAQLTAIIAQKEAQDAAARSQAAMKALVDAADKVKADNKWDAATTFDPNTLAFTPPKPKPAPAPVAPAKEPAK